MDIFLPIFRALANQRIRYVLVGGLATVLHGFARITGDIDLVLDLEAENCKKALLALQSLGFKSRAPVSLMDFADAQKRKAWIDEKGLKVFSLYSTTGFPLEVDLFVEEPLPFDKLYKTAKFIDIDGVQLSLVSVEHLIQIKKMAGRPQDIEDIKALLIISKDEK